MRYLIVFMMLLLSSCQNEADFLFDKWDLDHRKVVLIVPLDGCGSCIEATIDFFESNQEREELHLILTHATYSKAFASYARLSELENVSFDSTGYAYQNGFLSVSPKAIKNEGIYSKHSLVINPSNQEEVFEEVLSLIND